jgi:peptide-methionine (S)-S-oxide reductase
MHTIGFGGSCHWCTEAIFLSLKGVTKVQQGWIAPQTPEESYSEAVIVHFDSAIIELDTLIEIHLHTHSCTSLHSMRAKYRSAIYTMENDQLAFANRALQRLQADFNAPIIT